MKRKLGTLRLEKETIRSLTNLDLAQAGGGVAPTRQSCTAICPAPRVDLG